MTTYKKFGDKSEMLWRVSYGTKVVDGVVDLSDPVFLQYPTKNGEFSAMFGAPCLTMNRALEDMGVRRRCWVSVGSMVLLFPSSAMAQLKVKICELFGERPINWMAIKCCRQSAAIAIRSYRRRRDDAAPAAIPTARHAPRTVGRFPLDISPGGRFPAGGWAATD